MATSGKLTPAPHSCCALRQHAASVPLRPCPCPCLQIYGFFGSKSDAHLYFAAMLYLAHTKKPLYSDDQRLFTDSLPLAAPGAPQLVLVLRKPRLFGPYLAQRSPSTASGGPAGSGGSSGGAGVSCRRPRAALGGVDRTCLLYGGKSYARVKHCVSRLMRKVRAVWQVEGSNGRNV